jgi:catechol 2,3-dioxygenase-like lactoylglutathione lyase family enzyme
MINQITFTTAVYVRNQDRALDFYKSTLGLEKVADDKDYDKDYAPGLRWIEVARAEHEAALALIKPGQLDEGRIGAHSGIAFVVDDVREAFETLSDRGVRFEWGPVKRKWGWEAQFVDPDNNKFLIVDPLYHKRPHDPAQGLH